MHTFCTSSHIRDVYRHILWTCASIQRTQVDAAMTASADVRPTCSGVTTLVNVQTRPIAGHDEPWSADTGVSAWMVLTDHGRGTYSDVCTFIRI